jgi:putative membrane protein
MHRYLLIASAAALLAACSQPANNTDAAAARAAQAADSAAAAANSSAVGATSAAVDAGASAAGASASASVTTPSTPDFVAKAAATDMFEIAAAKLAEKRSKNADVKAFAAMMIHDHTLSTANLKAAIKASGAAVTPPAALPGDMQAKLDALKAASDADFDKAYIASQVQAHTDALPAMQAYAANGDTPQIKDFAAKTAPVVQAHLAKATSIQAGMG